MIKARGGNVVLLGLSRMNVERLMADMPILIDGAEVGLPGIKLAIIFGETEEQIAQELARQGLVDASTVIHDRKTGKGNH